VKYADVALERITLWFWPVVVLNVAFGCQTVN
jgi:hypothetical protein